MNEKFYALSEEKQSQILNAAYKVFATNQYQQDVQDATHTTLELLLSILNLDFIRKDIEFAHIYKEILYASDGMLKYWYRTGNYDVTAFEQEYLEMINHWEMVYGKGTENDRKQL